MLPLTLPSVPAAVAVVPYHRPPVREISHLGHRKLALDRVQGFLDIVRRDGSFEFYEPYLRRSIYGFKKKQLQLAASSAPRH